jgi:L-threonylcarbamoyladenylate synthase
MRIAGIEEAARIMRRGGVVAYPAEACFGLGCDPRDRRAVYRILALKGRALNQGLILVGASLYQLKPWLDPAAESLLEGPRRTWPGPWITGHRRSIAVRVTAMPAMARLCRSFGGAIVSTSANPRGMPPARTAAQVGTYFGRRLDAVVRGTTGGLANPTEIRDAAAGAVIRPG